MRNSNRFDQRLDGISSEIWSKIVRIDELKGQWVAGARLNPVLSGRLKRSVLVTSTGASTRIEGARLTDDEVEKLMRGVKLQKLADRDKQEVRGYYELLENVFDSWNSLKLSENMIKHFHQELLKYAEKDVLHRGEYKKQENKVLMIDEAGKSMGVLFDTTLAYLTGKEMQELVEWTQKARDEKSYHRLLVVGNFLVEFLQIHPFADGNGRLSRILTNLLLLKEGYGYMPYVSHEKLIEDNKPDYYMALRQSQKTFGTRRENIDPWLNFWLSIIGEQAGMAVDLLAMDNLEKILSPKQLMIWQYLQTVDEATPGEMVQRLSIARSTVNQVLSKLLSLRRIERVGQGRATRYRRLKVG